MFTVNIEEINTRQKELHKKAAEYRLIQSLKKSKSRPNNVFSVLGKVLTINQQKVKRYQPAL